MSQQYDFYPRAKQQIKDVSRERPETLIVYENM